VNGSGADAAAQATTKTPSDSIFSTADYYAEDAQLHNDIASQPISSGKELPYFDDTDTLSSLMSILPKDTSNIIQGVSMKLFFIKYRSPHTDCGSTFLILTQHSMACGCTAQRT
jgi:hypothetical protein